MKRLNLRSIPAVISASVAVMFSAGPVCAQTGRTFTVNGVGFEMVYVQGGTFTMEPPEHQVTLSDYYIGKYEVTQAQWKAVMGGNPSAGRIRSDCPVENVSWNDAQKFIRELNKLTGVRFALPTEAQWEYAARGGNKSHGYKYSGGNNLDYVAWHRDNSFGSTSPVGTKAPNELGLYDMTGNVREWCADWYGDYSADPQVNPEGPSQGGGSVVRGGDYHGSDEANEIVDETALLYGGLEGYLVSKMFRAAKGDENSVYYRDHHSRASTYSRIGFRLVLLPPSFPLPSLTLDKTRLSFNAAGGERTMTVTSNRDWTVETVPEWLTVEPDSGKVSKTVVTLEADVNMQGAVRSGDVVFNLWSVYGDLRKTVTVTQGNDPFFKLDKTGLDFSVWGGLQTVTVTANCPWTAQSDADWLVVAPCSDGARVEADINDSGEKRSATVTFKAEGVEDKSVVVTQGYSNVFKLDRTRLYFRADGGAQMVTVDSNRPWIAQSDADWLVVSPSSGGPYHGATVQINAHANSSTSDSRTATVTFRSEGLEKSLTVFQENRPYLELSREKLEFGRKGGSKTITVTSNRDWSFTVYADACEQESADYWEQESAEWLTVELPKTGTKVTITVDKNGMDSPERTVVLTFRADGLEKSVEVSQKRGKKITQVMAGFYVPVVVAGILYGCKDKIRDALKKDD